MKHDEGEVQQETLREEYPDTGKALTTADVAAATRRQPAPGPADARNQANEIEAKTEPEKGNGEPSPNEGFAPLFDEGALTELRARWSSVQTGFVDNPRASVEQADELVAAVMKQLAEVFAAERANLEADWTEGEDVSTEDLRLAFRRYRSFFDRLLSV